MVDPTLKKGVLTSPYGWRSFGWHGGVDFAGLPVGTPIYSAYSGKVTVAHTGCGDGYYCDTCGSGGGNWIEVTTNNSLKTKYMHLQKLAVSLGANISEGQLIGYLGNTGCTIGAHLHFEIWKNGATVDPYPYLQNAGTKASKGKNNLLPILAIGFLIYTLYED